MPENDAHRDYALSQARKSSFAVSPTFQMAYPIGFTNATFADLLCSQVNTSHLYITLSSPLYPPYLLPACFAAQIPNVQRITLTGFVIATFASLPPTLPDVTLRQCSFDLSSSEYYNTPDAGTYTPATITGFNEEGEISWPDIWILLPSITSFIADGTIILGGKLPDTLPKRIFNFALRSSGIVGTIPSNFFSNYAEGNLAFTSFSVDLMRNRISGSLPNGLLTPIEASGIRSFYLYLGINSITGTIPDRFLALPSVTSIYFAIASNLLEGGIPASLFENVRTLMFLMLDLSDNKLNGTLPSALFPSGLLPPTGQASFSLSLYKNSLSGTISPTFFSYNSSGDLKYTMLSILTFQNALTGTIPAQLFQNSNWSLTGTSTASIQLQQNRFTGTIPDNLLAVGGNLSAAGSLSIDLSSNPLTGSLPSYCGFGKTIKVYFGSSSISGTIPDSWDTCKWSSISVRNASQLTGSIPTNLFTNTGIVSFLADETSLAGNLPYFPSNTNLELNLSSTNIQFCSASSLLAIPSYPASRCYLFDTATCGCESAYVRPCRLSCTPSRTTACVGSPPTGGNFICAGGVWTASGSVNSSTLVIPAGSGSVVAIAGNLTSPSIVMDGLGSTIEVTGCVTNLTQVHVEISLTETGKLETSSLQEILSLLSSNCSVDLNTVSLVANLKGKNCRKLSVTKVISEDGSTMSGLFSLDKSNCNRWWIILVSVICGVIVLIVIALALMTALWPAFRAKIRPFAGRRLKASEL